MSESPAAGLSNLTTLADAQPGTWAYLVTRDSAVLCLIASWEGRSDSKFLIALSKDGARTTTQAGALYPLSDVSLRVAFSEARATDGNRAGMLCVTDTQKLLIYSTENGTLSEVCLSSGVSPRNAAGAVSFPAWEVHVGHGADKRCVHTVEVPPEGRFRIRRN